MVNRNENKDRGNFTKSEVRRKGKSRSKYASLTENLSNYGKSVRATACGRNRFIAAKSQCHAQVLLEHGRRSLS
jgi:hypothetical protein